MSKYLELKAQIEAMQAQLEDVRRGEIEEQVTDIKKKIVAFGITPDMLFSREDIGAAPVKKKIKYADGNGNTWSGAGGVKPKWFLDALAAGRTKEELMVKQ